MGTGRLSYEPIDEHTASITLDGDVESATAAALEAAVLAATRTGKDHFLVDLGGVRIADASLVESLLNVGRLVERLHGRTVVIATPGSPVRDALHRFGPEERIHVAATRGEGLTAARD
jgi:anti-anti-sigma regulatory factor